MSDHKGLPVHGYLSQTSEKVELVNHNKQSEEALLRALDAMQGDGSFDQRWLAIARTKLEEAFMAWNRAIFRPTRVKLEGDDDAR